MVICDPLHLLYPEGLHLHILTNVGLYHLEVVITVDSAEFTRLVCLAYDYLP